MFFRLAPVTACGRDHGHNLIGGAIFRSNAWAPIFVVFAHVALFAEAAFNTLHSAHDKFVLIVAGCRTRSSTGGFYLIVAAFPTKRSVTGNKRGGSAQNDNGCACELHV
uniref:Uncharacterized protein n=1 Tax=Pseudictyota dubia TaxID=2749911 RepID=A0A6U2EX96_9STRA